MILHSVVKRQKRNVKKLIEEISFVKNLEEVLTIQTLSTQKIRLAASARSIFIPSLVMLNESYKFWTSVAFEPRSSSSSTIQVDHFNDQHTEPRHNPSFLFIVDHFDK